MLAIFLGSAIIVFGTVPQSNETFKAPTASYILNAAPPFVTTEPSANNNIPNQPLFFAGGLSADEHTLTIRIDDAPAPYILEHFFVFPRSNITQHAVDTLPPQKPSLLPTTTSTPTSTPTPKAPAKAIETPTTVRILAGTLGSLLVLVVLLVAFFVCRQRRRSRTKPVNLQQTETKSSSDSLTSSRLRGSYYFSLPRL